MAKVFTLTEVAEHKTRNDCWVVLFGRVYNVTNFLDEHPGGDEVLLAATGKDATAEFDDIGHSHDAWAMLDKFYLGDLHSEAVPAKTNVTTALPKGTRFKYMTYLIKFLVPLIILNVAIAFYSKSSV
ncbi:hypothetical protein BUALT_Bualt02G0010800 [Buddleja alternifolia]|uniref:Cytochrome b5 heme-binding domain-containing protein n=1 Tax=Buddleja alternifolia TaxID=168488 RepID=A0AAV6Y0R1_9LAMI|nr:hypothetical protein BUALT_Bualt02G0010800 [Buddleja alternifolia]